MVTLIETSKRLWASLTMNDYERSKIAYSYEYTGCSEEISGFEHTIISLWVYFKKLILLVRRILLGFRAFQKINIVSIFVCF